MAIWSDCSPQNKDCGYRSARRPAPSPAPARTKTSRRRDGGTERARTASQAATKAPPTSAPTAPIPHARTYARALSGSTAPQRKWPPMVPPLRSQPARAAPMVASAVGARPAAMSAPGVASSWTKTAPAIGNPRNAVSAPAAPANAASRSSSR